MNVKIEYDDKHLKSALKLYIQESSRDISEILEKKAAMLISGGGTEGARVKGLYQEAHSHQHEVISAIRGVVARVGHAIRRKGGTENSGEEIIRRLKFAGFVQSTGWFNRRYGKRSAPGSSNVRNVSNPRGIVKARLRGNNPSITFTNVTGGAGEYAKKTGYLQRAVNNIARDMYAYVLKKQKERADKFTKAR